MNNTGLDFLPLTTPFRQTRKRGQKSCLRPWCWTVSIDKKMNHFSAPVKLFIGGPSPNPGSSTVNSNVMVDDFLAWSEELSAQDVEALFNAYDSTGFIEVV